jgi:hypothetical protein
MTHDPNFLAALVAAVSTFLVGGLWYSPILFAKPWMELNGMKEADLKSGTARIFGGSFVLALVGATNLAFFLADGKADVVWGMAAGALAGIGWVSTSFGVTYLFERRPLKLFFINAGYHAVSFVIMGAILGAWK